MTERRHHILTPEEAAQRLLPLLEAGAEVPLTVTGSSMVPFLRHGRDTVFLRGPDQCPPRVGDILLFRRDNGQWVLHRLHHRTGDGLLVINGDAQTWFETIRPEQAAGVAVRVRRGEGEPFSPRRWDWRLLTLVWKLLRPVRPALLKGLEAISRVKRRN